MNAVTDQTVCKWSKTTRRAESSAVPTDLTVHRPVSAQSWKSAVVIATSSCVLRSQVFWAIFGTQEFIDGFGCQPATGLINLCSAYICVYVCFRKRTGGRRQTRSFSGKTQTPNRRNHWSADRLRPGAGPYIPLRPSASSRLPLQRSRERRG